MELRRLLKYRVANADISVCSTILKLICNIRGCR